VGATAMRGLLEERARNGPFPSVSDLCKRADWKTLNKRALESLIKSGALDCLAPHEARDTGAGSLVTPNSLEEGLAFRPVLLANLDRLCAHGQRSRRAADL